MRPGYSTHGDGALVGYTCMMTTLPMSGTNSDRQSKMAEGCKDTCST